MFYGNGMFHCLMFRGSKCAEVKKWLTRFPKLTIECSRDGCNWTSRNDNMAVLKGPEWSNHKLWLPVSGLTLKGTCEKSRKKAEQTKSANLFDQPNFEMTTLLPPKLERQTRGCRESQLPRAEAEEQERPLAPEPGWEKRHCLRLRVDKPGGLTTTGAPFVGGGRGHTSVNSTSRSPARFSR